MPRLPALELVPDSDGEAAVRRDRQAPRDAGLASALNLTSLRRWDPERPEVRAL